MLYHDKMYDGLIPFSGYIVEELLLDENVMCLVENYISLR